MTPLPPTVEALLDELETNFPPRCIGPQDTLETAHRYAGAVELIEGLRHRFNHTKELPHVHR